MNLLYTLTAYPPYIGGAQLHQHLLAQQLKSHHQIQVCSHWDHHRTDWLLGTTLRAPSQSRDYAIDEIPVHRMGLSWREKLRMAPWLPLYYPWMSVALPAIAQPLIQNLQPFAQAVTLIHNVRIGREGLSYASWRVAQQRQIPFVLTPVHHPRWVGWRYQQYIRLYQLADAVITLTEVEKQTLITLGVRQKRIAVTGIGPILAPQADAAAFLQTHQITGPMVLFLGQHYRYKGYQQVLQAAHLVWQKFPDAHFVFIGPAVKQSEHDFQNTDPRIHRLGKVDLQEKTNALAACTLLCVPSSQESFGGVYTEAWSFAKPVIGCSIPAVAEVIEDGVNGYLVEQDPSQIASRICDLLSNPATAEGMGLAGQRKVEARYTWSQIAARTERVYEQLLNGSEVGHDE
ncbi:MULTISPECIES: glycosyltransferase family 4 protein [Trichocoleus]|uniref:Glycosyltransferase family 4 protein n=1 Tax=Trichocoleus desertorum GB2-A4 TaxID=2933944 RepID=A0ABV0JDJ0_9CYAN|nr:glycosyltransferase family 4 protein [Trichocoleus sp. FACHB-46]MBD1861226.1 glycosyltransferase family 4 protein [Trichocoleus sp. FACHB-46]